VLVRVVAGPAKGAAIALTSDGGTMGRAPENDLNVADVQVSRRHAAITWHDGRFWLSDLGSANGTSLNFAEISGEVALSTGDVIGIGDSRLVVTIG
jgi:pSer/pThr/pTyr-binding forkhead associated (FHA) protein